MKLVHNQDHLQIEFRSVERFQWETAQLALLSQSAYNHISAKAYNIHV